VSLLCVLWCSVLPLVATPQYPDCDFNCSAKDVTIVDAFVDAPDSCAPGTLLSSTIYLTFDNGANTDRYAVRILGEIYIDGNFDQLLDTCAVDALPPGVNSVPLTTVSWACGESLELRIVTVSWVTRPETCGDTPSCAARKAKCWSVPAVTVTGLPLTVDFTSDEPVCNGESIQFTSTVGGGRAPYTYDWEFGDGGISSLANPSYLYTAPGVYTATLTVTEDDGVTSSTSHDVKVSPDPVAVASNGGPYCLGDTIELFALGGVTYSWTGPNSFSSSDPNPTIPNATATNAGTYTVTVTSLYGCADQASTLVEIDATAPTLTVPADTTIECGDSINPAQTGQATANDDTDPSPTVTYSDVEDLSGCGNTGTITRTWTATDDCGNTDSGTQTITVVDTADPTLTISSTQFECDGSGNSTDISAWLASAVGTDTCGTVTVTNDYAGLSGDCPGIGSVDVTFTATDACANVTTRSASLAVVDTTAPNAVNDADRTDEDVAVLIDVMANDSDACDPSPTVLSVGTPSVGTAGIVTGQVRYTPPTGYVGTATFSYTIEDCSSNTASALVEVTVDPVNDLPVANDQSLTVQEDTPQPITVTATDPDGDVLTFSILSGPSNGTITGFDPSTGALTYTPDADYHGPDSFTFEACDPSGLCDTAVVTITVDPVDDPPVADPQDLTTPEDTPLAVTVTGSGADGDPLTYGIVSGPSDGTITGFDPATGDLLYTPGADFTGTDSFVFEACDPNPAHGCAQATVTIDVTPLNDPPVANDDATSTAEDTPVVIGVGSNDFDVDGNLDPMTVAITGQPLNGTASVDPGTGNVTYTPALHFNGIDTFTYQICDTDGECDLATVTVDVVAGDDPPVALDDDAITSEDQPITVDVAANDNDPDGDLDPTTVTVKVQPSNGTVVVDPATGEVTYTPVANFSGQDVFTYQICDDQGVCDEAAVHVTVLPVDDPPVANDETSTAEEDTPLPITVTATDPDGDALTYAILTDPTNGTISGFDPATGELLYTPDADYHGPDSFTFEACDPSGTCDTGVVTITVEPVDDLPVATPQGLTTPEDTPLAIVLIGSDADVGEPISFGIVSGLANGTISGFDPDTGDLLYTPNEDYHGPDSFTFEVCDPHLGHGCAQATVMIDVTPVDDPPVANDDTRTTSEDTETGFFSLLVSDPDNTLAEIVCDCQVPPSHGTVVRGPNHTVNYIPDPGFNGTDTFTYEVCDPSGLCDTATVTVDVLSAPDPPVAVDDAVGVAEDGSVDINVPANDSDPDGDLDLTSVQVLTLPAHGAVTVDPVTGEITYEPDENYTGTDTFTYEICDVAGACDTATVTVDVNPVADPPLAVDETANVAEDGSVTIDVPDNDSDPDGDLDITSVSIISQPPNGTVTVDPVSGEITYEPDDDFDGTDSFTYQICDSLNACDVATVEVNVTPVDDPPIANDDSTSTPEDTPVVVDVPSNDFDVDGNLDLTTVTIVSQPSDGIVRIDPLTGKITYDPDPNFNGTDTFSYQICDTDGLCDVADVTVSVGPDDDPPVALDDTGTVFEDGLTTIDVVDNDSDPDGNLDPTTVVVTSPPAHGDIAVDPATGEIDYEPDPNYNGPDTFGYQICDTDGACDLATVTIDVVPVDDPPVANDDGANVAEDGSVEIDVTGNDTDPDGDLDLTSVTILTQPSHGDVRVDPATGEIDYEPDPNYNGPDTFSYQICDSLNVCDTASVTVDVAPVDDLPVATLQDLTTPEDTPLAIGLIGSDADNDPLTYNILSGPSNGTISGFDPATGDLLYTPDPDYNGPDSFVFEVCDPHPNECGTATVTITVTPIDDPPVAVDDTTTVSEDGTVVIEVPSNDSDPDGNLDLTSVAVLASPANGTVTIDPVTGKITYEPDENFNGTDAFTYRICDTDGVCDTATVTVDVLPVDDPPVAVDDAVSTPEDTPVLVLVAANDLDPDGAIDPTSVFIVSGPSHGSVAVDPTVGEIIYEPAPNYSGLDSLVYQICNLGGACDVAQVDIVVTPRNDPPAVACLETVVVDGTRIGIQLQSSDPDGDSVAYEILVEPEHGEIVDFSATEGSFIYVPDGTIGPDEIAYRATDSSGATDECVVQLFVVATAGGGGEGSCELHVIISEIAWAGTRANPSHEWIELRNMENTPVDLDGWTLRWRRELPEMDRHALWKAVALTGVIDPYRADGGLEFRPNEMQPGTWWVFGGQDPRDDLFLLERGSDEAVLHIVADLVYEETLPLDRVVDLDDRGDVLELVDPSGCVVDTANTNNAERDGWAAGNVELAATMERSDPFEIDLDRNWHTNLGMVRTEFDAWANFIHGTPKAGNSPILSEVATTQGLGATRHLMEEPIVLQFEPRLEWPVDDALWQVLVTRPDSEHVVDVQWTLEVGDTGDPEIHVSSDDFRSGELDIWVRTPSGDVLIAPYLIDR